MASVESALQAVLERAERGPMNESNTKVLLIEPVLQALEWDTTNLDAVTREHKVYDGTFLDYALIANGRPVLFPNHQPPPPPGRGVSGPTARTRSTSISATSRR